LHIRIASRGSALALIQTEEVASVLRRLGHDVSVITIKSIGDVDQSTPLHTISRRGIFEKEVDRAVLEGKADIAVHSLKDVPLELPNELEMVAIPMRQPPYDAIFPVPLYVLKQNSAVATGSIRRAAMLKLFRPDLRILGIRGNVDTRVKKIQQGYAQAVVLAEAGLKRLGLKGWKRLNPKFFVPAAGQGALCVTCSSEAPQELKKALKKIDHKRTHTEALLERRIASEIEAGCTSPLGVHAEMVNEKIIQLTISLVEWSLQSRVFVSLKAPLDKVFEKALNEFEKKGGKSVVKQWRTKGVPKLFDESA